MSPSGGSLGSLIKSFIMYMIHVMLIHVNTELMKSRRLVPWDVPRDSLQVQRLQRRTASDGISMN